MSASPRSRKPAAKQPRKPAKASKKRPSAASAKRTAGRPAKKRSAAKPTTGRTAAKAQPAGHKKGKGRLASALRSGALLRTVLIAAVAAAGLFFVIYPVGTLLDQHAELDSLRTRQAEITTEIAEVDAQIASVSGSEGIELRARCFAHYVQPGTETYQVPGLSGCAEQP